MTWPSRVSVGRRQAGRVMQSFILSRSRPTGAELLVDEASDLVQLLEVGGLEERQEVPHVGLLPGHGGGGGGVGVEAASPSRCPSLTCLEDSWGPPTDTVSRHLYRKRREQSQKTFPE
ncbi:hypothetical protein EYF80_062461 [Liparis tanakae]|uniref:Uncharacterized protein n=1 Tax=Liparis tanakae TaxID=230148 RepID=A0A4Z2EFB5_9TELE|nr:hypothetical protein EYF80_062461 [Liparis tanakae]